MSRESMSPNPNPVVPVYRSFDAVPRDFGPSTAVIGNFDGVHRGHQQILGAAAAEARSRGMRSIAITFKPHPAQFLYPQDAPRLLTFLPERLKLLATTGVDAILVLRLRRSAVPRDSGRLCAQLPRRRLCRSVAFTKAATSVSDTVRRQACNELRAFGEEFGFNVQVHPAVRVHGLEVSSSAVRSLIAAGRHAPRALDAGACLRRAFSSRKGSRRGDEAAGAYREPGAV